MVSVTFDSVRYTLNDQETVLDGLSRHGITLPSSCRSGFCQLCLMKCVSGTVPAESQSGLKRSWREKQYFLSCICKPDNDIEISLPEDQVSPHIVAEVMSKEYLNEHTMCVRLHCLQPFNYQAGQYVHIQHADDPTVIRSYSLASLPASDNHLEIHVRRVPHGKMSNWIHDDLAVGQRILISSPQGDCYYGEGHERQGLLLIATGCGLAPLWGVLRDALKHTHSGPIRLFHGGYAPGDLYLDRELLELEELHENFSYYPCVESLGEGANTAKYHQGLVQDIALGLYPELKRWQVYICGNPNMVNDTKRRVYLAGAALPDIHIDPFLTCMV